MVDGESNICLEMIKSWACVEGSVNSTDELIKWVDVINATTRVKISEKSIVNDDYWFYDDYNGEVLNRKRSFFSVKGMRLFEKEKLIVEQPIIIQPEIGYLGIICKRINGIMNFLMQAKIEPGNVNSVQISPTIQATKSNFTRAHGGRLPAYFELFENTERFKIIYDQIQSEQATRFYKKRNRNIIMRVDEEFDIYPNFKWMTLGQIKTLMSIDNLVNMDTRTVLSGIPFVNQILDYEEKKSIREFFNDKALYESIFCGSPFESIPSVFHILNDYKMFGDIRIVPIPLNQLIDWKIDEYGICCNKTADFMVRYYNIEISGREVQKWTQPLFKATGMATFGLLSRIRNGQREYLVKAISEIGSFDRVELGPTVQWEPSHCSSNDNDIDELFREKYENNKDILIDVVLSEEGGRFYHEQNNNVIIEIKDNELIRLPQNYIWVNYATLNYLVQFNNCLNIQLRNLISLVRM